MNLIELALTTYTESNAERVDTADDMASEARAEFLTHARASATTNLCQAAAALDWQYVTDNLPDHVEEARALLDPVRTEYLRYRIDNAQETAALELVQPCLACRTDRVSAVTSLFHLGQLLNEEQSHVQEGTDASAAQEPGPLAAVEAAEQRAASVAALARRLLAQYPGAGLTVDTVAVFGHESGGNNATLRIDVNGMEALRQVAASMGRDVETRMSGTHPGMVFEHGSVKYTADGIDVDLLAYTRLSDDEAAALLNQPAEDTAAEVSV